MIFSRAILARLRIFRGVFPLRRSRPGQWGLWTHLAKARPLILLMCSTWVFQLTSWGSTWAVLLGSTCLYSFDSLRIRKVVPFSRSWMCLLRLHSSRVIHKQCSAPRRRPEHQIWRHRILRSRCRPCQSRSNVNFRQAIRWCPLRERSRNFPTQLCDPMRNRLALILFEQCSSHMALPFFLSSLGRHLGDLYCLESGLCQKLSRWTRNSPVCMDLPSNGQTLQMTATLPT